MKLYVWRGPLVLRNYASGMVVVAAESVDAAFAKLRAEEPGVWLKITHGGFFGSWIETEADLLLALEDEDIVVEPGFPLQPEEFSLETLPVLYVNGGE